MAPFFHTSSLPDTQRIVLISTIGGIDVAKYVLVIYGGKFYDLDEVWMASYLDLVERVLVLEQMRNNQRNKNLVVNISNVPFEHLLSKSLEEIEKKNLPSQKNMLEVDLSLGNYILDSLFFKIILDIYAKIAYIYYMKKIIKRLANGPTPNDTPLSRARLAAGLSQKEAAALAKREIGRGSQRRWLDWEKPGANFPPILIKLLKEKTNG